MEELDAVEAEPVKQPQLANDNKPQEEEIDQRSWFENANEPAEDITA